MINRAAGGGRFLYERVRDLRSQLPWSGTRPAPIVFVFGHQKSGTSVIARSAGQALGMSASIDFPLERLLPRYPDAYTGRISAEALLRRNLPHSAAAVIKEPSLTPLGPELLSRFPISRAIVVRRNPLDVVESILHRLDAGTDGLVETIPFGWHSIIECRGLPISPLFRRRSVPIRLAWRAGYFDGVGDAMLYSSPTRCAEISYEELLGVGPMALIAALSRVGLVGDPAAIDLSVSAQPGRRDEDRAIDRLGDDATRAVKIAYAEGRESASRNYAKPASTP